MNIPIDKLQEILKSLPDVNKSHIEIGQSYFVPVMEPIMIQKTYKPNARVKGMDLHFVKGYGIDREYQWFLII